MLETWGKVDWKFSLCFLGACSIRKIQSTFHMAAVCSFENTDLIMSHFPNMLKTFSDFPSPLSILSWFHKSVKSLILCPRDTMEFFFTSHIIGSFQYFYGIIYFHSFLTYFTLSIMRLGTLSFCVHQHVPHACHSD